MRLLEKPIRWILPTFEYCFMYWIINDISVSVSGLKEKSSCSNAMGDPGVFNRLVHWVSSKLPIRLPLKSRTLNRGHWPVIRAASNKQNEFWSRRLDRRRRWHNEVAFPLTSHCVNRNTDILHKKSLDLLAIAVKQSFEKDRKSLSNQWIITDVDTSEILWIWTSQIQSKRTNIFWTNTSITEFNLREKRTHSLC